MPELVENLLNKSFKNLINYIREYLTEGKSSKHSKGLDITSDQNVNEPAPKMCLKEFYCYEEATRRGYSLVCEHSEPEICDARNLELIKSPIISLKVVCQFDLKKCVDASPCMTNLYQSQRLLAFIGSHSGLFCCINVKTKKVEWAANLPNRIESSSCISSCANYVFVGCYDYKLYCMEIDSGTIHWTFLTNGEIKCSPVVSRQNIAYFGSRDKYLYAVKVSNGKLVWKRMVSSGSIFSSPALCEKRNLVCVSTLNGMFSVLKMDTGNIVWTFNHEKPMFSSPVFTSTSIYIGSTNNCLLQFDILGKLISEHPTNGPIFSSPVTSLCQNKEHIVFGCHDGNVYCIGHDNENIWKHCFDSPVYATPFIFSCMQNSYVAVASTSGMLYILNLINGDMITQWKCPGEIFSSPVILNRFLIVGCRDNNVYIFSLFDT